MKMYILSLMFLCCQSWAQDKLDQKTSQWKVREGGGSIGLDLLPLHELKSKRVRRELYVLKKRFAKIDLTQVEEFQYLEDEIFNTRILKMTRDFFRKASKNIGDWRYDGKLYGYTELRQGAPTIIYPVATRKNGLTNLQIQQLLVHEGLHRALPFPLNHMEKLVEKLTHILVLDSSRVAVQNAKKVLAQQRKDMPVLRIALQSDYRNLLPNYYYAPRDKNGYFKPHKECDSFEGIEFFDNSLAKYSNKRLYFFLRRNESFCTGIDVSSFPVSLAGKRRVLKSGIVVEFVENSQDAHFTLRSVRFANIIYGKEYISLRIQQGYMNGDGSQRDQIGHHELYLRGDILYTIKSGRVFFNLENESTHQSSQLFLSSGKVGQISSLLRSLKRYRVTSRIPAKAVGPHYPRGYTQIDNVREVEDADKFEDYFDVWGYSLSEQQARIYNSDFFDRVGDAIIAEVTDYFDKYPNKIFGDFE